MFTVWLKSWLYSIENFLKLTVPDRRLQMRLGTEFESRLGYESRDQVQISHRAQAKFIQAWWLKYYCDQCDDKSTLDHDLKQHRFIHACLFDSNCDMCDDKLTLKCDLKQHILIHTWWNNIILWSMWLSVNIELWPETACIYSFMFV